MKAMILAAGQGRRLAPLTDQTPKPLLPVKGKPLIEWQIRQLQQAGFNEIVINTHHLGEQIMQTLGDGRALGVTINYSPEKTLLETAGGIKQALPLLGDEPFVVLNGDIWTNFDFSKLTNTIPPANAAHIVLTPTPDWRDSGDFEFDGTHVTARGTSYVYCGIAVMSAALIAARTETVFSLRDVYFDLMTTNQLTGQVFQGTWLDIGTIAQYESLQV